MRLFLDVDIVELWAVRFQAAWICEYECTLKHESLVFLHLNATEEDIDSQNIIATTTQTNMMDG